VRENRIRNSVPEGRLKIAQHAKARPGAPPASFLRFLSSLYLPYYLHPLLFLCYLRILFQPLGQLQRRVHAGAESERKDPGLFYGFLMVKLVAFTVNPSTT
jgi:hypothetical protein